jgi:hypothetical protein
LNSFGNVSRANRAGPAPRGGGHQRSGMLASLRAPMVFRMAQEKTSRQAGRQAGRDTRFDGEGGRTHGVQTATSPEAPFGARPRFHHPLTPPPQRWRRRRVRERARAWPRANDERSSSTRRRTAHGRVTPPSHPSTKARGQWRDPRSVSLRPGPVFISARSCLVVGRFVCRRRRPPPPPQLSSSLDKFTFASREIASFVWLCIAMGCCCCCCCCCCCKSLACARARANSTRLHHPVPRPRRPVVIVRRCRRPRRLSSSSSLSSRFVGARAPGKLCMYRYLPVNLVLVEVPFPLLLLLLSCACIAAARGKEERSQSRPPALALSFSLALSRSLSLSLALSRSLSLSLALPVPPQTPSPTAAVPSGPPYSFFVCVLIPRLVSCTQRLGLVARERAL